MRTKNFAIAFVTAATLLSASGSTTSAQPAPGSPAAVSAGQTIWVVTADNLLARSGDAYSFYPVSALKAGTVVIADGERGGYIRVLYPAGTRAIVKADEAKLDVGRLTLTRPTTLQAFNQSAGVRASWNPLLDKPLPPGTELVLIEEIKDPAGATTHFAVQPPASARAYVDRQGLRRATDAELAAAMPAPAAPVPAPALAAVTPATVTPSVNVPAAAGAVQPTSVPTITMSPGTPASTPIVPAVAGGAPTTVAAPDAAVATTPATVPQPSVSIEVGAAPSAVTETVSIVPVAPVVPEVRKPSREEQLMVLFNRLRATPVTQLNTTELAEAIEQFETYKIIQSGDPATAAKVSRVDGYLSTLTLMRDVKSARDSAAGDDARWATKRAELGRQIAALEKQRVYQVIGLLVPSAIYDGVSLPKFYRIQSPEPGSFRTLGYIAPGADLGLDGKVGNVIGIMGDTTWDESLKAPRVTATRVDVVSLAAIIGSPMSASEILGTTLPAEPAPSAQPAAPSAPVNTPGPFEIRIEPTPDSEILPEHRPTNTPGTTQATTTTTPVVTGTTVVKPADMQKP